MKKLIALLLLFVMIFSFAGCASFKKGFEEGWNSAVEDEELKIGDSKFDFIVIDANGNETAFEVPYTEGETVGEALLAEGLIAGEDSDYGLFVTTVNGITLDYETDGKYWGFYIGDEFATTSVDLTDIVAGTTYKFVVTEG